jgi:uncharacterized cupredoxin-like copper-binding protein
LPNGSGTSAGDQAGSEIRGLAYFTGYPAAPCDDQPDGDHGDQRRLWWFQRGSSASTTNSPGSSTAAGVVDGAATGAAVAAGTGGTSSLHVDLADGTIKPDASSIKAGNVQITAANTGTMAHELVIMKTPTAANALPMAADGSAVNEDTAGSSAGELDEIAAGQSKSGTFTLTPGHYVLLYNEPGHYKEGMAIDFTVN